MPHSRSPRFDPPPAAAVRRLSIYLRHAEQLASQGRLTISSRALGDALDFTDAQVRKDLAYFGHFGHPGVGYRVPELVRRLREALGTDRSWPVALIGAGNLGRALASHPGFAARGFSLTAVFDAAAAGETLESLVVEPMESLSDVIRRDRIRLAILAVPADAAQEVADRLVESGVTGILNFAPVRLNVPDHVTVNAVDIAAQLEQLAFAIRGTTAAAETAADAATSGTASDLAVGDRPSLTL